MARLYFESSPDKPKKKRRLPVTLRWKYAALLSGAANLILLYLMYRPFHG